MRQSGSGEGKGRVSSGISSGEMACLSVLMIDHNVMRLHIAVHDALAVTEVERLEELVDVVPHVDVVEFGVEAAEIGIVDVLEDE